MDEVARWSDQDRADLFQTVAAERNLSEQIIEKDFWVCWTLKRLFTLTDPPATLLFKGGTSLSKAYGLIERFSEDIDLAFAREELGLADDIAALQELSIKKRDEKLKDLTARCKAFVQDMYLPALQGVFSASLGEKPGDRWELAIDAADERGETLLFRYPRLARATALLGYVRPMVRLELGARAEHEPSERKTICSYAAELSPDRFAEPQCEVVTLSAARTFWEKVTLLHQCRHAADDKPLGDRLSRHYYDVHRLFRSQNGADFLRDVELLARVVTHKQVFYRAAWAKYETAKPGTLSIVPNDARHKELAADYDKMAEMIFGEVPAFEEILESIAEIERRVNQAASPS